VVAKLIKENEEHLGRTATGYTKIPSGPHDPNGTKKHQQ
jgi:hypothetical protein